MLSRKRVQVCWNWCGLRALVPLSFLVCVAGAHGDEGTHFHFDIPAQSVGAALEAFGQQSGALGVYDGRLVEGLKSAPVEGDFTPMAALSVLLGATGLTAQYTAKDAFVVVWDKDLARNPTDIAAAALSAQSTRERRYSGLLQQAVGRALCTGDLSRPGDYRAVIVFRVDQSGATQRVKLLGSTGDTQRDTAIVAAAGQVSIGQAPPAQMKQPFTMVVLPRATGGTDDCGPRRERN